MTMIYKKNLMSEILSIDGGLRLAPMERRTGSAERERRRERENVKYCISSYRYEYDEES